MNVQQKTKGFTIIEVVLVLAIAGLIFLIIFLALPALQRNQRDQARRSDLGRVISAVQTYQSNSSGNVPFTIGAGGIVTGFTGTFKADYLDDNFKDPSSNTDYTFSGTIVPAAGQVAIYKSATAGSDCKTATASATGTRYVYRIDMENGDYVCQFN